MIRIENIYYMLSYAFGVLQEQGYRNILTEEFENATELLCAILCKGVAVQVKRGLARAYVTQEEPLCMPKGKIELTQSLKVQSFRKKQIVCRYDTFSVDFYLNQILKTTLKELLCMDISKKQKKEIRKLLLFFSEVSVLDSLHINWNIRYEKNNQTYAMLLAVCEMIIKGGLQTNTEGHTRMMEFLDEQTMPKLYEKFLLQYFRKEHKELKVYAPQISWNLDNEISELADNSTNNYLPVMKSDIVISNKETKKTLIIDAKYYTHSMQTNSLYRNQTIHSANLYQIFAYVKNWKAEEEENIMGMLLYARTEEEIQPNCMYQMSGNQIYVRTLDLNCKFDVIKKQLDGIAKIVE